MDRVVVTGMGVVSPLGWDPEEMHGRLMRGESAVRRITAFDPEGLPSQIAAEVDGTIEPGKWLPAKLAKRADRYIGFMVAAARMAMADAGITVTPQENPKEGDAIANLDRAGVVGGSATGGMSSSAGGVTSLFQSSYRRMSPFCIPFAITNMGSALTAMELGLRGPNYSASSACATGNHCISLAAGHIARGEADFMLAGSSDAAVLPIGMAGFAANRALSTRNDDPPRASRPWEVTRDGFVMGEGAAILSLESLSHARARGAKPLAEIAGHAYNCDAYHMTEPLPGGEGAQRCMEACLRFAGERPEEVDYVNAHATSTPAGDIAELKAIERCLKVHEPGGANPTITSTKSMVGHLLGASGSLEAVAVVKAIQHGEIHPSINLDNPAEGVDTSMIAANSPVHRPIRVALSNSFGFGGHNCCLAFRSVDEQP